MQDQVSALQATGVSADYLSSTRTAAERRAILDQLTPTAAASAAAGSNGDRLALLYVTPELIATDRCVSRSRHSHATTLNMIQLGCFAHLCQTKSSFHAAEMVVS